MFYMGNGRSVGNAGLWYLVRRMAAFVLLSFLSISYARAQRSYVGAPDAEETVKALAAMGYLNVGWYENDSERIYVLENDAYRLVPQGIGAALDTVMRSGLPDGKGCRLVFLENRVPQVSLFLPFPGFAGADSVSPIPARTDWDVTAAVGKDWRKAVRGGLANSSLFKVDVVVYPELYLKNLIITQIYQALINLSPAVEVSLWPGMKLTAQMVIPVYNDGYGSRAGKVHPGIISVQQTFRLPYNIWATVSAGTFTTERYGADLKLRHTLVWDERFSVEARAGVTGTYRWDGMQGAYGTVPRFTWSVGGSYYWPRYNVQASLKAERYLLGETGVRLDLVRHFRYASIGFYMMKADGVRANGGFRFQIALPPYRYCRTGYVPRVLPARQWGMSYNAGNERYYYQNYRTSPSDNIMQQNAYNPYYIKNELGNGN